MPEYLRAMVVILVMAIMIFALAYRPAGEITLVDDFKRRRNLWIALTLTAFLSASFWIYTLVAAILLLAVRKQDPNPPSTFLFLLFLLPVATVPIPAMGLLNNLFDLGHARLLTFFILLPAFLALRRQPSTVRFGKMFPDKVLAAYMLLLVLFYFREPSITNSLRLDFYLYVDLYLIYYVMSRFPKSLEQFRDIYLSLVVALLIVACVAVFEAVKHWLLYATLTGMLMPEGSTQPLGRDGLLRAVATTEQPIVLGYIMVIGIGAYLFLQKSITVPWLRWAGMALLAAGAIAALSRGPWLGAALLLAVFMATGRHAVRRLLLLSITAVLLLSIVSEMPGGEKIINLLPFIGKTESENITYREQLITNSLQVIERNFWFGSRNFLDTPEMEEMRQGQGIIDVVNSYIAIALKNGVVGVALFAGFFLSVIAGVYSTMRRIRDRDSEEYLLGRSLLASLLATMMIIFTVSSITFIPIVYWSLAGFGVAYMSLMARKSQS